MESWSLLHWLYPHIFTKETSELFKSSFDLSKGCVNTSVLDSVKNLLKVIMLRRMKDDLGIYNNLSPKKEILLFIPLTPMQKIWYTKLLTKSEDMISIFHVDKTNTKSVKAAEDDARLSSEDRSSWNSSKTKKSSLKGKDDENAKVATASHSGERIITRLLLNLIMQLRKCCIHPYLIPGCQPDPYEIGPHVIQVSGKFIVLKKLLLDIICQKGEKVLIFSSFTIVLNLCEELLSDIGNEHKVIKYLRLDGDTCRARRNLHIRLFQNSNFSVMLLTTRAGGLGITLTAANNVIFLDEDWNPQMTLQAEGRAHRVGQTKAVKIYKLCTHGTVEEQMRSRIQKKLYLSTRVTSSVTPDRHKQEKRSPDDKLDSQKEKGTTDLNQSQLKALVRKSAQVLIHPEIGVKELLSWDLETTIKHCESQAAENCSNGQDPTEFEEEEWLSKMEHVQCAIFEGKRHYRPQQDSGLPVNDQIIEEPRRRRKSIATKNELSTSRDKTHVDNEKMVREANESQSYGHQKV